MHKNASVVLNAAVPMCELIELPCVVAGSGTASALLGGSAGVGRCAHPVHTSSLYIRPSDPASSPFTAKHSKVGALAIRINARARLGAMIGIADRKQVFFEPCDQQVLPNRGLTSSRQTGISPGVISAVQAFDASASVVPRNAPQAAQLMGAALTHLSDKILSSRNKQAKQSIAELPRPACADFAKLLSGSNAVYSDDGPDASHPCTTPHEIAAELIGCPSITSSEGSKVRQAASEAAAAGAWAAARGVEQIVQALRLSAAQKRAAKEVQPPHLRQIEALQTAGEYWQARADSKAPWQVLQGILQPGAVPPTRLLPPPALQGAPYAMHDPESHRSAAMSISRLSFGDASVVLQGRRTGDVPATGRRVPLLLTEDVRAIHSRRIERRMKIPPTDAPADWQFWIQFGGDPGERRHESGGGSNGSMRDQRCSAGRWMAFRVLVLLRQLFHYRPVWPQSALEALVPLDDGGRFQMLSEATSDGSLPHLSAFLPGVAYHLTRDPFRQCWVRLGFDPRASPTSRVLQMIKASHECRPYTQAVHLALEREQERSQHIEVEVEEEVKEERQIRASAEGGGRLPVSSDSVGTHSTGGNLLVPPRLRAQFRLALQPPSPSMSWALLDQLLSGAGPRPQDLAMVLKQAQRRTGTIDESSDDDSGGSGIDEPGGMHVESEPFLQGHAERFRSPTRQRSMSVASSTVVERAYLATDGSIMMMAPRTDLRPQTGRSDVTPLSGFIEGLRVPAPTFFGLDSQLLSHDVDMLRTALPSLEQGVRDLLAESAVQAHLRVFLEGKQSDGSVGWLQGDTVRGMQEAGRRALAELASTSASDNNGAPSKSSQGQSARSGERFYVTDKVIAE